MKRIRVLLADDSCLFLRSIVEFLSDEPWIEVVGTAASGLEAVKLEECLRPDLVLMDWSMPGLNGLEAMRRIKAQANAPHVIMLTGHAEPEYAAAALNDQADGFVNKAEAWFRLLPCIRQLYSEASDGIA